MKHLLLSLSLLFIPASAQAQASQFQKGPILTEFGESAAMQTDFKIPRGTKFKILYDIVDPADPGQMNRKFNTPARFLNMHARAGVPEKNMKLAVVIHGKASLDVANAKKYAATYDGTENVNAALIKALTEQGVRVILCGQSASFYGIGYGDTLPGVEMALSAMTAHAVLQQEGYTLNPF
jgi:intracellular sulfur oxidation DsrE/DsrF family protein